MLSNGCVVSMMVSGHSGDVEKIFIDKSMVGKFSCESVCEGEFLCMSVDFLGGELWQTE